MAVVVVVVVVVKSHLYLKLVTQTGLTYKLLLALMLAAFVARSVKQYSGVCLFSNINMVMMS